MDLFVYLLVSAVYIMVIHFGVAIKNQFNLFLMGAFFIFGAILGGNMQSYEMGFVAAVILSLIFW